MPRATTTWSSTAVPEQRRGGHRLRRRPGAGESIVGYFTGSYRQGVTKNAKSGWYRMGLQGTTEGTLTYARCVDTTGGNASCWAQYGLPLPAANAGPYRTCPNGNSCACKFKPVAGKPAEALGGQ